MEKKLQGGQIDPPPAGIGLRSYLDVGNIGLNPFKKLFRRWNYWTFPLRSYSDVGNIGLNPLVLDVKNSAQSPFKTYLWETNLKSLPSLNCKVQGDPES